jgi:hypothetical protein
VSRRGGHIGLAQFEKQKSSECAFPATPAHDPLDPAHEMGRISDVLPIWPAPFHNPTYPVQRRADPPCLESATLKAFLESPEAPVTKHNCLCSFAWQSGELVRALRAGRGFMPVRACIADLEERHRMLEAELASAHAHVC